MKASGHPGPVLPSLQVEDRQPLPSSLLREEGQGEGLPVDSSPPPLRLCVVDDDPDLLEVIRDTLAPHPHYTLAGLYSTAEDALARLSVDCPDILILDYKLPGLSGIDCIRLVHERFPTTKLLLITGHLHQMVSDHLAELRTAHGCLPKPFQPAELISALDMVVRGLSLWPAELQTRLLAPGSAPRKVCWHPRLSRRENEVMALLNDHPALLDQDLADKLHISRDCVRSHLTHIFHKFKVHRREDALRAFRGEQK